MNKLYNKIYEAVNTGIQKALIIKDDQIDDTSINWETKRILNNINMMSIFVEELRMSDNDEIYLRILEYYNNTNYKYIAKDFDDFISLYYRISLAAKRLNIQLNMDWVNADNAVTLIKNNGDEISIYAVFDHFDIAFVRIKNPLDDGNDIYLKKFGSSDEQMPFLHLFDNERYDTSKIVSTVNDGFMNCNNIMYQSNVSYKYTAVNYALNKKENIGGIRYKGYIPAGNQFALLTDYHEFFDQLMVKLHGFYIDHETYWISNSLDIFNNYVMKNKDIDVLNKAKEAYCYVIYKRLDN